MEEASTALVAVSGSDTWEDPGRAWAKGARSWRRVRDFPRIYHFPAPAPPLEEELVWPFVDENARSPTFLEILSKPWDTMQDWIDWYLKLGIHLNLIFHDMLSSGQF